MIAGLRAKICRPIGLCLALLALGPAPLAAQDLPALYRVTSVAPGDVLYIRAEPKAGAKSLGSLAPSAAGIEVIRLSDDGKWGMVFNAEGNGWVSMRYLSAEPVLPGRMPRPMRCLGTEPFWSLTREAEGGTWSTPATPARRLAFASEATAATGYFTSAGDGQGRGYHLIISRDSCSDGMSDRLYGFSARLFLEDPAGNQLYAGCCSLDAR